MGKNSSENIRHDMAHFGCARHASVPVCAIFENEKQQSSFDLYCIKIAI